MSKQERRKRTIIIPIRVTCYTDFLEKHSRGVAELIIEPMNDFFKSKNWTQTKAELGEIYEENNSTE